MAKSRCKQSRKCPVVWISKLQSEIALSTVDYEYIALSQATREIILLIQILTEIGCIWPVINPEYSKITKAILLLLSLKISLLELDASQRRMIHTFANEIM